MAQQPFGAGPSSAALQSGPTVQQQVVGNNSLGLAVGPQVMSQQQQQQQSQYSPQANYYQQLIKQQQQQQHFMPNARQLNGLNGSQPNMMGAPQLAQYSSSQQNSPSTNQQADATSGIYNGRPAAPIYAPKPTTIYPQYSSSQSAAMYQHSPVAQMPTAAGGLSVRQLPAQQSNGITDQQQQQHQQQMQQLIMSYHHQQQQHLLPADPLMHVAEMRWPNQLDEQHQHLTAPVHRRPHNNNNNNNNNNNRFAAADERDSISTLSRFNQFDERRSFTMRSQYTNANKVVRNSRHFGFFKLAGQALRGILGLDNSSESGNLQRNLSMSAQAAGTANKQQAQPSNKPFAKVTAIDSGEDYYFKRQVFKYRLVMLRLVNLVCAALVLLSPVAMLLIPKMEFVFRSNQERDILSGELGRSASGITHALGIGQSSSGKQVHHASQAYFTAQPQWRISDCNSDCDGPLIGFVGRLIMLCVAYWAIFFRPQTATLARIDIQRCLLSSAALLLTLAYWLFFMFRVFDKRFNDFELQYMTIVQFALSLLESLILLHYLAVVLLELRSRKKLYCLKVVRSPDGASQYYSCGSLSIQKCAQFVLEKYHRNFAAFDSLAEHQLQLEDQAAAANRQGDDRRRPSSPANSTTQRDTLPGGRHQHQTGGRRSNSRASRHRSRTAHPSRSASPSPVASRPATLARHSRRNQEVSADGQVRTHQMEVDAVSESQLANGESGEQANKRQQEQDSSNSADQSSDATSRMKESSLETIKAANSSADLLSGQQLAAQKTPANAAAAAAAAAQSRDDTESVRSGRSRRSERTNRSHHHHHHHRRDTSHHHRSSSRAHLDERHHAIAMPREQLPADPVDEHERKLRRRRFRLLGAVQDTFERLKRIDQRVGVVAEAQDQYNLPTAATSSSSASLNMQAKQTLGPHQAARSLYPSIARSLQKYLRLTKQTGRHNLQSIYEHLAKCLLYGLSARTFIEKFTNHNPVWQQSETNLFAGCKLQDSTVMYPARANSNQLEINSWSLVCDTLLSRHIDSGTFFVLHQGQVSLLVTVAKLPHLSLKEEVIDQKSCKFSIEPNSESAV